MAEVQIPLVVDVVLRRPACVILQAVYGCGASRHIVSSYFDPQTWLVAPTADMHVVRGSRSQWLAFADEANTARKESPNVD